MRAARAFGVAAALLLAGVPLLTGCAASVAGPSLVLRLASPDKADDDTAAPIRHFAAEVARRSGGTIRVEPVWDVAPPGVRDWDQTTARTVVQGTYELGFVPARAFDVLGVDSLRALNAPFLVTSQDAARTVLDSSVRDDLMAGLPEAGLVGIDLVPDALRHPFGYDHPLLGPEDYGGELVRTATSDTIERLFASLGATTTDDDFTTSPGGAESQFSLAPQGAEVATGNVTFFTKTNVLVAGEGVARRLRSDQWDVLEEAGAATRAWQFDRIPSDAEAAAVFCRKGGTIVTASPDQVLALQEGAAAVSDWLSEDPATRRLLDAIGRLVRGRPEGEAVTGCPARSAGGADGAVRVLDGTYLAHVRRRDLVAVGVDNEAVLSENTGRLTWTLKAGRWSYVTKSHHYVSTSHDTGRYDVEGDTFTFYWDEAAGDWTRMRFRVGWDGTVTFTEIVDGHEENQALSEGFFGVPWTRVGGNPR